MDALLSTQPENYWRLLRRSLYLYRISFKRIILLAFLLSLTTFVPRLLSAAIGEDILHNLHLFSLNQLWLAALNFVAFIFFIAIIWHMHCETIHKHESLKEDFKIGYKKAFTVFIAASMQSILIMSMVAAIIGTQMLIHYLEPDVAQNPNAMWLAGVILLAELTLLIYIATLFIFIVPLIAVENKGILSALRTSTMLVWNHWWRTISLQVTPWICFILAMAFLKYILALDIHLYLTDQMAHPLLLSVVQLIMFAFFVPWVAATLLVQLQDLELRKNLGHG